MYEDYLVTILLVSVSRFPDCELESTFRYKVLVQVIIVATTWK